MSASRLPNVHFLDPQLLERLPDLLGMADIHLLPQRADAADLVMPSKLTGMLASAVVATAHPGTELTTVVQTCGVVVSPEDPAALAQAHLDRDAVLQRFEADVVDLLSNV